MPTMVMVSDVIMVVIVAMMVVVVTEQPSTHQVDPEAQGHGER